MGFYSTFFFSFVSANSICLVSLKHKTCTFFPSYDSIYYLYLERICPFKNPSRNNSHFFINLITPGNMWNEMNSTVFAIFPSYDTVYYLYPERIRPFKNPSRNNAHFSVIQSPLKHVKCDA